MTAFSRTTTVRGWWAAPLLAVMLVAMPWPQSLVETWYSRTLYPVLQSTVTMASNVTSVAIIDMAIVLAAMWVVWRLWTLVADGRSRGWIGAVWTFTRRTIRLAGVIAVLFYLHWGLNYRRVPLEASFGPHEPPPTAIVVNAVADAGRRASTLRAAGHAGVADYADVAARLAPAFARAVERLVLSRLARPGTPKISHVLTPFFTAAGVTGMVNPVALESIVHPDLLPFERPMVLAHEWAHLAGYADEADASAVGWAACMSGDADLQYAAHMFLLLEGASQIPRAEWTRIRATLDPGVTADFAALAKRLTRQQPVVREAAFTVYDQYLRTNQVEDGVRSYGRAVRVLMTPQMRALLAPTPF